MSECGCVDICRLDGWDDQFQSATRELLVFTKSKDRFFDLDAVREPFAREYEGKIRGVAKFNKRLGNSGYDPAAMGSGLKMTHAGAPPLDWWFIPYTDPEPSNKESPNMTATFYIGDAIETMGKLPEQSVDLVLTSPPFLALRSYLPADHPDKAKEGGSQATPGEYVDWLLDVVEACSRVLAPHGSLCFELGDTYSGSGGAGGDYQIDGTWPLAKSLSLIPESFRFAMVYGHNPFTGRKTEPWRLRNVIRWVRPNPPVGALGDKFRPATSELMVFCKAKDRYFDLDAVREPLARPDEKMRRLGVQNGGFPSSGNRIGDYDAAAQSAGAPPLDWWNISLLEGEEPTRYGPKEPKTRDELPRGNTKELYGTNHKDGPGHYGANVGGSPPLDWWNIPLLEGEEPTRMGPKERPAKRGDVGAKRRTTMEGGELGPYVAGGSRCVHGQLEPHYTCVDPLGHDLDACTEPKCPGGRSAIGAPPLDWWNIPPGGYPGAHYAVWPPELLVKPVKAMCPSEVCRTCGEPRRRIVNDRSNFDRQPELAAHIRAQREALKITHDEINGWFGFKEIAKNWERTDKWGAAIPSAEVWPVLKERLNLSGEEFDDLVLGERTWTESLAEYRQEDGTVTEGDRRKGWTAPEAQQWGANTAKGVKESGHVTRHIPVVAYTDCSHDDFRPGLVLDPFAGSGTTLAVATGHGRDAIGIDLDERNYELALDRVGPLVLELGVP